MEKLENMKRVIAPLMQNHYKAFIAALISLEKGIDDEEVLERVFQQFMEDDSMLLLNDKFDELIRSHEA